MEEPRRVRQLTRSWPAVAAIDTTVPHSARIWNYWLGGSDNFPVDREAGDQYREIFPDILKVARADLQEPPTILEAAARTLGHSQPVAPPEEVDAFGGVGRKP